MKDGENLTDSKARMMVIFCLPMFILSLFPCYALYRFFHDGRAMEKWIEIPAVISSTELIRSETHNYSRPSSRNYSRSGSHSVVFRTAAVYTYYYEGKKFEGNRVSILPLSDNFSPSYHKEQVRLLAAHKESGEPYRCFVDPVHPDRSILFPKPPLYMVGIVTLFALVFVTLGFGGTFAAIGYFFQKSRGAKLYDGILKVIMPVIAFILVVPLTYFCYKELRQGAWPYAALWLIVPIYLIWSTFFFKKKVYPLK